MRASVNENSKHGRNSQSMIEMMMSASAASPITAYNDMAIKIIIINDDNEGKGREGKTSNAPMTAHLSESAALASQ